MPRTSKQERLARVYDKEVLPIWAQPFGRVLLQNMNYPEKGMLLDVGCGTGYPSMEVLRKTGDGVRIIAIDKSPPLMDLARSKAEGLIGRRIFFRTEDVSGHFSFADNVYDITYSNVTVNELPNKRGAVLEMTRVTDFGGQVIFTVPVSGSWQEFYDIYRSVLTKRDRYDIIEKLDREEAESFPEVDVIKGWMEEARLSDIQVQTFDFELLFKSAREFFYAPVVEFGPLRTWKELAGSGDEMQDIFLDIKDAIDTIFQGLVFPVTIQGACFSGIKEQDVLEPEISLMEEGMDREE